MMRNITNFTSFFMKNMTILHEWVQETTSQKKTGKACAQKTNKKEKYYERKIA